MKKLYLGSQSRSRHDLLREAGISFFTVPSLADESSCDWTLPLQPLVTAIALHKMEEVVLPAGSFDGEHCFVLTGDTMGVDAQGIICGKPRDREDAIRMLRLYRNGAQTGSAFCVERRAWSGSAWVTQERRVGYASAQYIFDVPDALISFYLDNLLSFNEVSYDQVSGAVAIEKLGAQFVSSIQGSYTAICGLPMFEVRSALQELGFFDEILLN